MSCLGKFYTLCFLSFLEFKYNHTTLSPLLSYWRYWRQVAYARLCLVFESVRLIIYFLWAAAKKQAERTSHWANTTVSWKSTRAESITPRAGYVKRTASPPSPRKQHTKRPPSKKQHHIPRTQQHPLTKNHIAPPTHQRYIRRHFCQIGKRSSSQKNQTPNPSLTNSITALLKMWKKEEPTRSANLIAIWSIR